jgi:superfamily II DNA helicase RecQ
MKLKVFTLAYHPDRGFDDLEMQEFMRDRHVLSVTERFFEYQNAPVWALLVTYRQPERPSALKPQLRRNGKPDWRSMVPEPDRALFDALRDWRNNLADARGIPGYNIAKNQHLVDIVKLKPTTRHELMTVAGIGEKRAAEYGESILMVLRESEPEKVAADVS